MILGKPWLTTHNPQTNWRTNEVQLMADDTEVRAEAYASTL